jgi:hypothetical protein
METPMQTLSETILAIVPRRPGIADPELAFAIYGRRQQQLVNGECRHLASAGRVVRRVRPDGIIGNYSACPTAE